MARDQGWNPSSEQGNVGSNPVSNNKSGFNAVPGGIRFSNGEFRHRGEHAKWWSSTETSAKSGRIRFISWDKSTVSSFANSKKNGFSVRCVKDFSEAVETIPRKENVTAGYSSANWNDESAREYGLFLESSEGAAGSSYVEKSVYAFVNSEFSQVFSITHRFQSFGPHTHGFIFNIIRNEGTYYDIETFDNESYDGVSFTQ